MAGSVGNADCKEERTARVIIDRRGIARYFFPRSSEQGAWPPGVKSETFMRGWRRIGEYILPRTRTCLPACLPFSPARDPTDLRKHALIYGGFHPSVVVGILTIYENPPPRIVGRLGSFWLITLLFSLFLIYSVYLDQFITTVGAKRISGHDYYFSILVAVASSDMRYRRHH